MNQQGLTIEDLKRIPPAVKRDFIRVSQEFDRRRLNEGLRYLQLTKPTDPNPWSDPSIGLIVPCNDQYGYYMDTSPEVWCKGSNRSMKTHTGCAIAGMFAMGIHEALSPMRPAPVSIRVVGNHFDNHVIGILLKKFQTLIPWKHLRGGSWKEGWNAKSYTIHLENGSRISFRSSEQDVAKFAGDDLDMILGDEHMAKRYYIENKARLVDRNGFYRHGLTLDLGSISWESKHWRENAEKVRVYHFTMKGNPHISKAGQQEFMDSLKNDPTSYAIKVEGREVPLAGLVIPQFDTHVMIGDKEAQRLRDSQENIYGCFAIDPHLKKASALLWGFWTREKDFIVYKVTKQFLTVPELKKYIKAQSVDMKINLWLGDEAMGGDGLNIYGVQSVLQQLATGEDRIPIVPTSQGSDKSFEAGVMKLRDMMSPDPITGTSRIRIAKSCSLLLNELEEYQFVPDQKADEMTFRERVYKVNDDLICCLRYAVMAEPSSDISSNPVESGIGGSW